MRNKLPLFFIVSVLVFTASCQGVRTSESDSAATMTTTQEIALATTEDPVDSKSEETTLTPLPVTETLTEPPTITPTETPTPSETATLTAEISPTETIPATPDPSEGLGGILYDERFDGSSGWGWTYIEDGFVTFVIDSGGVKATFEDSNQGWRVSLGPDSFSAGNQRAQVTARALVCGEQDEWGFLYRGEFTEDSKFNGYIFKINCSGQVRVERLENNQSNVLLGWTPIDGVETGEDAENTLMVWAVGDEMRFYVNDIYVDSVMDDTYESGGYGIYAQDRTNGNAEYLFIAMRVYQVVIE